MNKLSQKIFNIICSMAITGADISSIAAAIKRELTDDEKHLVLMLKEFNSSIGNSLELEAPRLKLNMEELKKTLVVMKQNEVEEKEKHKINEIDELEKFEKAFNIQKKCTVSEFKEIVKEYQDDLYIFHNPPELEIEQIL